MGNTCDECKYYRLSSGMCRKHNVLRHSCAEDACDDFILADDLAALGKEATDV